MASKAKIAQCLAGIKTIYPYAFKDTDMEQAVRLWAGLLKDYSDDEVGSAVAEAMKVCKNPPVPADVIDIISRIRRAFEPTDEELTTTYFNALKRCDYLGINLGCGFAIDGVTLDERCRRGIHDLFVGLPNEIKTYLGDESTFIEKSRRVSGEIDRNVEEGRFRKALPQIRERIRFREIGGRMQERIESAERKRLND